MKSRKIYRLRLPSRSLVLGERTLVMGVLNVTPDSFSDGGKHFRTEDSVKAALAMQRAGADILDIGAESTRPGSMGISAAEELGRLLPVLRALHGRLKIPISIDTQKASVAEMALGAGAEMVNDISGLRHDARIAEVAAQFGVPLVLMHMRGTPRKMQKEPFAKDVMRDVASGLRKSVEIARRAGVRKSQIIVDPGIGFGKKFCAEFQVAGGVGGVLEAWVSIAGGKFTEGIPGGGAGAEGKAVVGGAADLGDGGECGREYFEWGAYCAGA